VGTMIENMGAVMARLTLAALNPASARLHNLRPQGSARTPRAPSEVLW